MKTKLFAAAGIILLISLYSFSSSLNERFTDDPFTKLKLKIGVNVILNQGDGNSVKIDAPDEIANEIVTEVENGTLIIKYKNINSWRKVKKLFKKESLVIYVTMEEIEGLRISGSGNITSKELIKSDRLDLGVSGSGNIVLAKLSADKLSIGVSGSGNIKIQDGNADRLAVAISGSGNVDALSIDVDEAAIKISGSGNCKIGEADKLIVTIAGSGDVHYKGDPNLTKKISGSGNVKPAK